MEHADRTVEKKGRKNDWEEAFQLEAKTRRKFMKFLIKSVTTGTGLTNQTPAGLLLWGRILSAKLPNIKNKTNQKKERGLFEGKG